MKHGSIPAVAGEPCAPGPLCGCSAQTLSRIPSQPRGGRWCTQEPRGQLRKPPERKEGVQQGPTEPGRPPARSGRLGVSHPVLLCWGHGWGGEAAAASPRVHTGGPLTPCALHPYRDFGGSWRLHLPESPMGTAWRGVPCSDPGERSGACRRGGARVAGGGQRMLTSSLQNSCN